MRYAKIIETDIANGLGVGCVLFVQGCHANCFGCFNPETHNFNGGYEFTNNIKDKFVNDIVNRNYISRITILGGEPLCDENVIDVYLLLQEIKQKYPNKKIWLYTGYSFENIYFIEPGNDIESYRK